MLIRKAKIIFSGFSKEQNFQKGNILSRERADFNWLPNNCQGIYQEDFREGYKLYFNFEEPSGVVLLNKKAQDILKLVDGKRNIKEIFEILSAQTEKEIKVENLTDFSYLMNFFYTLNRLNLVVIPEIKKVNHRNSSDRLSAWISVTNQCNLACEYCYVSKNKSILSEEVGKKAIDKIFATALKHKFREIMIKFSGGEPLLELPLVFKLADRALQKSTETGIKIYLLLLSNGTLINPEAVDGLKKRNIRVGISLDGIGKWHDAQVKYGDGRGSFKEVEKTIDLLIAKGFPPSIIGVISSLNLPGLPELANYLIKKRLGATFNFVRVTSLAEKKLIPENDELIKTMKEVYAIIEKNLPPYRLVSGLTNRAPHLDSKNLFGCGLGRDYIVIDSDGDILPCQMCLGNKEKKLGNLGQAEDLLEITQKAQSMNPPVDEKNDCRDCPYRYVCQGCPIFSNTFYGSFKERSPYCEAFKVLIPKAIRIEGERLWRYEKVVENKIIDSEGADIKERLDREYNPEKYKNKKIIILGVHSHNHNAIQNTEDREYYYLSKYIKENPNVVVYATSPLIYFQEGGYKGFEYIENNFGIIYYIDEDVWGSETGYQNVRVRRKGKEIVKQLHKVLDQKFPGKQVVLLRPGSPFIGDGVADYLLKEAEAKNNYLVIDDKQAEIYNIINRARDSFNIIEKLPEYYLTGSNIDCQTSYPLQKGSINVITCVHEMYNCRKKSSKSLFVRVLDKLLQYYPSNLKASLKLPAAIYNYRRESSESLFLSVLDKLLQYYPSSLRIYLKSPITKAETLTLRELRKKVADNEEYHKNIRYTMVIGMF